MKKNFNEQIHRIKSLFTEERLYGNLVEQKEELDNINKYGIIGTTSNIKLIKVTNSKFKIKPNGDVNLFKYEGDKVYPDKFILPDVKSIFSSKIGLDLDKYDFKIKRERDAGGRFFNDVIVFTITPKAEIKPDVTSNVTPEIKPDVSPEIKPDVSPEIKPDVSPEIKPVINPKLEDGDITPKLQKYGAAQAGYRYIYDGKNKVVKKDKSGKILATYIRESYINKNSLFESVLTFEIKNSLLEGWKWIENDKKFSQSLSDKFDKATGLSDKNKSDLAPKPNVTPKPDVTPKPELENNKIINIFWSSSDDHNLTTKKGYLVNIGDDSVDEVTDLVDGFVDAIDYKIATMDLPSLSDIKCILETLEKIKNIKIRKSDFKDLFNEDNYFLQSLNYSVKNENYLTEILNKAYKLDEDVSLKDDLNELVNIDSYDNFMASPFGFKEYRSTLDKIKNLLPSIKF